MFTRLLTEKDRSAAKALWGYAFETDEPFYTWYFKEIFKPENALGIFVEDQLICYLQLNPYKVQLRGQSFDTSYVVGVITDPGYRNKGLMRILLPKALEEMKQRNHFVSILMPFDTSFYRPYGWELCYSQRSYEVPLSTLHSLSQREGFWERIYPGMNVDDLHHVYQHFLKQQHGYIERSHKGWDAILKDLMYYGGYAYLLRDHESQPVGYILYFLKDGKFTVREVAYTNHWAQKSIFGFMYSHKSQATTAVWPAPLTDKTYLLLRDTIKPKPTNTISVYPFMCSRIVDMKETLTHCRFEENLDTSFTIKIEDIYAPWNEGAFRIDIQDGRASILSLDTDETDLSCDINTLAQLIFGAFSVEESMALDKLTVHEPSIVEQVSKVFTPKNNFINEFF
ncbi:GNAT family N-acetyltransferase [Clostridiaceae bacterium 35-E11]